MITSNVIQRTFAIKYKDRYGTCFTIDVDNEIYLITARHIVEEITGFGSIQIYFNHEWIDYSVALIGHTPKPLDISVLTGNLSFSSKFFLPPYYSGVSYGQDVYYLGFPAIVDISSTLSSETNVNRGFPMPMVKHAILSIGDDKSFLIDGYATPGFSGGPLVFKSDKTGDFQVAGVIANYKTEIIPVYETELEAKNNGGGKPPIGYCRGNSAIITATRIEHAMNLIRHYKENR